MKKILLLLLLPAVIFSGCTNLDEVEQRLDNHEDRITSLEIIIKQINSDIIAMKTLIDAINKNNSIVSYKHLDDSSGYELLMSDGQKIILKSGTNGKSPIISVQKHTDGVLYWTLDGKFMLDSNEKMIPAESKNGKNGTVPKMRINENNQWEVSLNNGHSWEIMLDENGNPIAATGESGSVNLKITETDKTIIINYNGQVYIIEKAIVPVSDIVLNVSEKTIRVGDNYLLNATITPVYANDKRVVWSSKDENIAVVSADGRVTAIGKGTTIVTATSVDGSFTATCKINTQIRPKLSIEYVTEYNINEMGTDFTDSHSNDVSGYFTWNYSMRHFALDKNFAIDGVAYHLPTLEEWFGIVPDYNSGRNIKFNEVVKTLDYEEHITIANQTNSYTADYFGTMNNRAYGLRFKGQDNEHRSAWRYEYADNPTGDKMMTITVRYLGSELTNISIDDIAQESWWNNNTSGDIVRIFPATGHTGKFSNRVDFQGRMGYYWTATESTTNFAKVLVFNSSYSYSGTTYSISDYGLVVRLFHNK